PTINATQQIMTNVTIRFTGVSLVDRSLLSRPARTLLCGDRADDQLTTLCTIELDARAFHRAADQVPHNRFFQILRVFQTNVPSDRSAALEQPVRIGYPCALQKA